MRKTIFTLGLMLAAALSLTNCTKNEEANFTPEVKVPFEFYANMDDTRTVNDGMVGTDWVAGDAINVFHAEATTETYVPDGSFTTEDATGLFTGTLAGELTAEAYDWYVFYPYSSYIKTPANTSAGYMPVGCKSNEYQTQNGNNSMAHIAGENYPLVGVVKGVAASDKPAITMSHVSSLVEFNVTNNCGDGVIIKSIELTAGEDIVGTYYINFAGENLVCTSSGANFVSNKAKLIVSEGEAIAEGDSAKFYMGIKPFTAKNTDNLTITITTNQGVYSLSKKFATTFHPGKIKTINVNMDELVGNEPSEPTASITATISFKSTNQRVYQDGNSQVWRNENVTLTNNKASSTNPVVAYTNPVRFYQGSSLEIDAPGSITKIVFDCNSNSYATELKNSISSGATVTVSSDVVTVEPSASANSFVVAKLAAQVRMDSLTVTYVPLDTDAPYISLSQSSVSADADATSVEISWTLTNLTVEDVAITSSADWVTFDAANDKLTINIADNTARDAREATVTLNAEGLDEIQISVKQLGIETLDEVTIAQFLEKSTSDTAWYKLTGTISDITNTTFGNFNITDETGTVYVYGLTKTQVSSNDKSFASIGLKEGDIVTLIGTRAEHDSSAQVGGPAYYVSHIASCVAPTITCEENVVTITAEEGATIYYTTNGDNPTTASEVYSEPFTITANCTVKAFAVADNKPQSIISEKVCTYTDPNQEQPAVDYSTLYTSNVTLSTTGGTKTETAKVIIGGAEYNAIKAGTSSVAGVWKVTVPAGTTKLHLHMAGWNGKTVKVKVEGANADVTDWTLKSDTGVNNKSPFTLAKPGSDYYKVITLSNVTVATTLTFTATSGYRFVVWGVNAAE